MVTEIYFKIIKKVLLKNTVTFWYDKYFVVILQKSTYILYKLKYLQKKDINTLHVHAKSHAMCMSNSLQPHGL